VIFVYHGYPSLTPPLVMHVIDRVPTLRACSAGLRQAMADERLRHRAYTREAGDHPPGIRDWTSPGGARDVPA
jgi:xylulose-5-phosphate/fructose-6-phosphate phosphoketolase